jgi:hypothetical protein
MIATLSAQDAAVSSYLNPQFSGSADVRIREVRMPSSGHTIGTYWCTLGYWTTGTTSGYGGLQWTPDTTQGPKNYIYSQWNDYSTSAYHDPATQVKLFGGEGTGVKSINNDPDNQWAPDYWHVTADRVWDEGSNTYFAYIVKNGETDIWTHMITWNTPESNLRFSSAGYTFLEDWRGDGAYRESQIRKGWNRRSSDQSWIPVTSYEYSINENDIAPGGRSYNKRENWRGGIQSDSEGEFFYMGAGGSVSSTNNSGTTYTIDRTETSPREEYGTVRISDLSLRDIGNEQLEISWSIDATTVPQWSYGITVQEEDVPVATYSDTLPQCRKDTITVSGLDTDNNSYTVELSVTDFFDGVADPVSETIGSDGAAIQISDPPENTVVRTETDMEIHWSSNRVTGDVNLYLINGAFIQSIASDIADTGTFLWTVHGDLSSKTGYQLLITSVDSADITDTSSAFTIVQRTQDSTTVLVDSSAVSLAFVSSEETEGEDGAAVNVLDGDISTIWHTEWSNATPNHPHALILKTDSLTGISGLCYIPRQTGTNGTIAEYLIEVSTDSLTWKTAKEGTWDGTVGEIQSTAFNAIGGKYMRLRSLSDANNSRFASASEMYVYEDPNFDIVKTVDSETLTGHQPILRAQGSTLLFSGEQDLELSIFSAQGQLIHREDITKKRAALSFSELGLSRGVYLVKARVSDQRRVFHMSIVH